MQFRYSRLCCSDTIMRLPRIASLPSHKSGILQITLLVSQFARPIFTLIIGYSDQSRFEIKGLDDYDDITEREFTKFLEGSEIHRLDLTNATLGELIKIPFNYFAWEASPETLQTIPQKSIETLNKRTKNDWSSLFKMSDRVKTKSLKNNTNNQKVSRSTPLIICSDSDDSSSIHRPSTMTFNPKKSRRPSFIQDDKAVSLCSSSDTIHRKKQDVEIFFRKNILPPEKERTKGYESFELQQNNDDKALEDFKFLAIESDTDDGDKYDKDEGGCDEYEDDEYGKNDKDEYEDDDKDEYESRCDEYDKETPSQGPNFGSQSSGSEGN